jgi:RND family efflux transporter MFP subunit
MTALTHPSSPVSVHAANGGKEHVKEVAPPDYDEQPDTPPEMPQPKFWFFGIIGLILTAGFVGLFLLGWIPRSEQKKVLLDQTEKIKNALPKVIVIKPRRMPAVTTTQLPGDVQALEETTIYPRTSGYMRKWLVDIGDEVKEGQLLAEVDTPEIDQELRQAEATLNQLRAKLLTAQTNMKLAQITLRRNESLSRDAVSLQDLDQMRAAVENADSMIKVAESDIAAGVANVNRIKELKSFSKIYAPFAGTITSRNIELGHLVTSGNSNAQSLFRIAKTGIVRVFVNVPQMYAPGVKPGQPAELIVREMAGRKFQGKVTRTARSIDPLTRTLLTEVQVPNEDHALLTGSYVQVRIDVTRENPPMLVPATSLVFNSEGTRVALLRDGYRIHLKPVVVEGEFGTDIGISAGLGAEDEVVTNPGDSLTEGCMVQLSKH